MLRDSNELTAWIALAQRLWTQDRGEDAIAIVRRLHDQYPGGREIVELLQLYSAKLAHMESDEAYFEWYKYVTEVTKMGRLDDTVWRCFWITSRVQIIASWPDMNSLIDIGCGRGEMTVRFAQTPDLTRIVGVDLIPLMVEDAKTNPANTDLIEYMVCPAEQLGTLFDENEFDIAVLSGILEHVRDPDLVLAQARRVVKPGGAILINVPFGGFTFYGHPHSERYGHVRFWDPYEKLKFEHMEVEYKSYYRDPGLYWAQYDEVGDFCVLLWNAK